MYCEGAENISRNIANVFLSVIMKIKKICDSFRHLLGNDLPSLVFRSYHFDKMMELRRRFYFQMPSLSINNTSGAMPSCVARFCAHLLIKTLRGLQGKDEPLRPIFHFDMTIAPPNVLESRNNVPQSLHFALAPLPRVITMD